MKKQSRKKINIVSLQIVKESHQWYSKRQIQSPDDAVEIARQFLGNPDREHLIAICLSTKYEPTHIETVSIGSLDTTVAHPREMFKTAIMANSAAIILVHNHPSGNPEPSDEDQQMAKRVQETGKLLGIQLLDCIILGDSSYISMKEVDLC